jgi:transcriptional regulator with XRE-family HTH domain
MANLRIKEAIKAHGLTVERVAGRMGVLPSALSQSINGNPTADKLEKIAAAIGCAPAELFEKPKNFVALVSSGDEVRRFDRPDELAAFIAPLLDA